MTKVVEDFVAGQLRRIRYYGETCKESMSGFDNFADPDQELKDLRITMTRDLELFRKEIIAKVKK